MEKEQSFEEMVGTMVLEMNVYADGPELTQEDLDTIDSQGHTQDIIGYIGNSDRNYLTDEWVLKAAWDLGWDRTRLAEWACSRDGRWALDSNPHSVDEMRAVMSIFAGPR